MAMEKGKRLSPTRANITSVGQEVEQLDPSSWREWKMMRPLEMLNRVTLWLSNSTPRYTPRELKTCPHKYVYTIVHSNIIYNGQKLQTTHQRTDRWMDKQRNTSTSRRSIQQQKVKLWRSLRRRWPHWEKPDTKAQTQGAIPCMWTVQNGHILRDRKWVRGCQGLREGAGSNF